MGERVEEAGDSCMIYSPIRGRRWAVTVGHEDDDDDHEGRKTNRPAGTISGGTDSIHRIALSGASGRVESGGGERRWGPGLPEVLYIQYI